MKNEKRRSEWKTPAFRGTARRFGFIAAALVVMWAACAAPVRNIKTDYDPGADFSVLKSYAWEGGTLEDDRTTTVDETEVDLWVRKHVDEVLARKGYDKGEGASADFRIRYRVAVKEVVDEVVVAGEEGKSRPYASWKYRGGEGKTRVVNRWNKGMLVLQVLDGPTGRIVWEGSAQAEVDETPRAEAGGKKIERAVRQILGNFPPK